MEYKTLILKENDGILKITLNRPQVLNSMSDELIDELGVAINDAGLNDDVKVIILTGAGDAFCSGADISQISKISSFVKEGCPKAQNLVVGIMELEKPVIAAVNGYEIGRAHV